MLIDFDGFCFRHVLIVLTAHCHSTLRHDIEDIIEDIRGRSDSIMTMTNRFTLVVDLRLPMHNVN